jgi:hypothetical protein
MVGQDVQASAADKRSEQEFGDVEAILHEQGEQAAHLGAQDDKIIAILEQLQANTALTEAISRVLAAAATAGPPAMPARIIRHEQD